MAADPGFTVTVNQTDPPHARIATFMSGDKLLFAPAQVDVKVDAPPQGYDWHAVALSPGHRAALTLDEVQQAELTIQPMLQKLAIDKTSRVIVYRAGTQNQVAVSDPAPEHKIALDPGTYDVFIENQSGKGRPYTTLNGVHLDPGAKGLARDPRSTETFAHDRMLIHAPRRDALVAFALPQ